MTARCAVISALILVAFGVPAFASLVINGSFDGGNTGFYSAYAYHDPGYGVGITPPDYPGRGYLFPEGRYTVDRNPANSHAFWYSMGDHTSGTGNMLIVNGKTGPGTLGDVIWRGTVNFDLTVGTVYDLSAWLRSVDPADPAPASLTFKVGITNDVNAATTLNAAPLTIGAGNPPPDWQRLFQAFTAPSARPYFFLVNAQNAADGNDFAVDDINVFTQGTQIDPGPDPATPEPGTWALLASGLVAFAVTRRKRSA